MGPNISSSQQQHWARSQCDQEVISTFTADLTTRTAVAEWAIVAEPNSNAGLKCHSLSGWAIVKLSKKKTDLLSKGKIHEVYVFVEEVNSR
jgi:hypothetical protein